MVEGDERRCLCLVVGGGSRDRLVTEVRRITVDYQVSVARCESVYTAVAELARTKSRMVLVIGSLRELATEKGRFFALAARNRARCCAVLDGLQTADQGELLAAVRGGAAVVDRVAEVRGVLERWLGGGVCHWEGPALAEEEYRATEAELRALLGHEADG